MKNKTLDDFMVSPGGKRINRNKKGVLYELKPDEKIIWEGIATYESDSVARVSACFYISVLIAEFVFGILYTGNNRVGFGAFVFFLIGLPILTAVILFIILVPPKKIRVKVTNKRLIMLKGKFKKSVVCFGGRGFSEGELLTFNEGTYRTRLTINKDINLCFKEDYTTIRDILFCIETLRPYVKACLAIEKKQEKAQVNRKY